MNQLSNNPIPPLFSLKIKIFLAHDEPTTWIPTPIIFPPNQPQHSNYNNPTFCFPATRFPNTSNITSGMNSDTNSNISVLYSISQLKNPNIETFDEFADSEPSPSNNFRTNSSVFSKPPFQPIPPNNPLPSISTTSYASQVTPTYSSFHSDRSSNSPDIPQISQELYNNNYNTLTPPL